MAYPTLYSGQRFTASLATSMLPITAVKTADTSRASTTTASADPELQVTVEANGDYVFHACIRYSGETAADFKMQFTTPGGGSDSGVWGANYMVDVALTDDESVKSSIRTPLNSSRSIACISPSTSMMIMISGRIRMGGTGGIFSMDWAQNTSNASATVVSADSWMSLTRVG